MDSPPSNRDLPPPPPPTISDLLYTTYGIMIKKEESNWYNDIYTWGRNDYAQLGNRSAQEQPPTNSPILAKELAGVLRASYIRVLQVVSLNVSGGYMVIEEIQTKKRLLYGWGRVRLGYEDNFTITEKPQRFNMGNTKIIQVVCSDNNIYLLVELEKGNRAIYSIGTNQYGELGIGSNEDVYIPTIIPSLSGNINNYIIVNVRQIASGSHHCMAWLRNDNAGINILYSWGRNDKGQLGVGSTSNKNAPQQVLTIQESIVQIACGESFSMMVIELSSKNRVIYSWGLNDMAQLGIESNQPFETTPQQVAGIEGNIIQIACSRMFSLALMESAPNMRYIYYWGFGFQGKMVIMNSTGLDIFTDNIKQIYCDDNIGYALLENGQVYCWDFNTNDYLTSQLIPINNPPIAFPIYNIGSLESYFGIDFIYEDLCAKMIPMCRKMGMMPFYSPIVTGGNNPKLSSKMKYSQSVRTFKR